MLKYYFFLIGISFIAFSCKNTSVPATSNSTADSSFVWKTEAFADVQILRYRAQSFDKLNLNQKLLVYYLVQAGLSGRDIIYDQNYRYNLSIRKTLENIITNFKGDTTTQDWKNFEEYTKQVWFANGIHHHYSADKMLPRFTRDYFSFLMNETKTTLAPEIINAMFDPKIDAKRVSLDPSKDLIKSSAVNFYDKGISEAEVTAYYKKMKAEATDTLISFGLNSKLVLNPDGTLSEKKWTADGMYGAAIKQIIFWLEKAVGVAENPKQAEAFKLLIEYYKTGNLQTWDKYNVAWAETKEGDVDYINSFIEVYNDPKGMKGSFESIVQINDFTASERMKVLSDNAQWFEDHSTIMPQHKKEKVIGVSYKVVEVAGESGDAAPLTPIGVNLPNADWIRQQHGSKSVSLGSITEAYEMASGSGTYDEFASTQEEKDRYKKYGSIADKLFTALHEVIGHASGKLEKGTGDPAETMQSYASAMEEARADIVALYFITDPKMVELGLLPSPEAGKAAYDNYISNGMMKQLRRLEPGKNIEEAHMRNRQLIADYAFEKGKADNVISKLSIDGKTYFKINDYNKLRTIFGDLLKELQRIKSQGDYNAAQKLIEKYAVVADQKLLAEVKERAAKLNVPPYSGFIQPELSLVKDASGNVTDVKIEYPMDFKAQMLKYAKNYSFLPEKN